MIIEYCEKCGSIISQKMARVSESYCEKLALCIKCQKKWLDHQINVGKYPKKLVEFSKKKLEKFKS